MFDKNKSSIWTKLDFGLVKNRIRQINKWFEPFINNHDYQLNIEELKDSQTESSEFDITRN